MVGGGVLIWLVDRSEYPNPWVGMWWAIQTAATVGYGDVTPRHVSGRIVGVVMMLWGVAFISIVTAIITTTFITRARVERGVGSGAGRRPERRRERPLRAASTRSSRSSTSLEAAIRDSTGR